MVAQLGSKVEEKNSKRKQNEDNNIIENSIIIGEIRMHDKKDFPLELLYAGEV